jgi:predicted subunit of tRNA(5-methylaminomethyl-2-thiouridylate) methyltransferase
MRGEISWHVELTVRPGELDNFRALTRAMVDSTKREPGVLIYERFVSEDGRVVSVYERYADSAAAVTHLLAFGNVYGKRFVNMVDRTRFTVFGTPTAELRAILDRFGVTYLAPFEGFSRVQKE